MEKVIRYSSVTPSKDLIPKPPEDKNDWRLRVCQGVNCGREAGCDPVPNGTYRCVCPHDRSEAIPPLFNCPRNKVGNPSAIHHVSPPNPNQSDIDEIPTEQQQARLDNYSYVVSEVAVSAAFAAIGIAFISVMTLIWWKRRKSRQNTEDDTYKSHSSSPVILPKGVLMTEQFVNNPNYYSYDDNPSFMITIILRDQLRFLEEIGQGCFGKVYKGEYVSSDREGYINVAVKVLKDGASKEAREDFAREVDIMSSFRHDNILSLVGVVIKDTGKNPWMVFEFMPYGDLAKVLRSSNQLWEPTPGIPRLSKGDLHGIATQIAAGMAFLSSQHFVHRDLACRNCLLGKNLTVKISDFGMSRDIYTCDYYKVGGVRLLPIRWMSPESVMYGRFTLESDIWSFGVVLWEIYSFGKTPYFGHTNEEVIKLILQGIMLTVPEDCPPPVCQLMRECWKTEPRDRIKFVSVHDRLGSCCNQLQEVKHTTSSQVVQYAEMSHVTTTNFNSEELDRENYLLPKKNCDYIQPIPD